MQLWQAVILGVVQGITEFLPVSSSGHLAILQNWLEINPPPTDFDIFLHLISVIVIIYYFRQKLFAVTKDTLIKLTIATLPVLAVGFFVKDIIIELFSSNLVAGLGLLITAALNFLAADSFKKKNKLSDISIQQAGAMGLSQVIALVPGISRSGSTLFGASICQIKKEEAYEFSFLMAIFAISAASGGQFLLASINNELTWGHHWSNYLVGGIICFFTSLASLKLVKVALNKERYHLFGWYCLLLGLFTLGVFFI